jgi:hypothetical protein
VVESQGLGTEMVLPWALGYVLRFSRSLFEGISPNDRLLANQDQRVVGRWEIKHGMLTWRDR